MQSRGHSPRTICTGAPTSSVDRRRAGVEARPYGGLRGLTDYVIAPHQRRPQPLSHGASRRDSSPSRGAKGWVKVCGVGATVYHDADTVVFLPPVRGGVPDAPRLRDRRAALDAPVRPDRFYPRHPRSSRLASAAQRMQFRGHSPRTISYGRPTLSVDPRREGVEARPYGGLGRLTGDVVATHPRCPQPLSHGAKRRDSSPFRGAE